MRATFGKLLWKLFLGNVALMAIVLGTGVWLIVDQVDRFYAEDLTTHLRSQAEMLRHVIAGQFDAGHAAELNKMVREIAAGDPAGIRITLIAADGTVLAESERDPAGMESHRERPEVQQALREGWGQHVRSSKTLSRDMKYVAVRVGPPEAPVGFVRVAMAVRSIGEREGAIHRLLWIISAGVLAAAVILALGLASLWSGPISRITSAARSLSHGDLSARAEVSGRDEIAILARSLNHMRDRLAGQLETIDRQRRTLQSLLAQLREGVIVVGPDGRIMLINPAAARLLGLASGGDVDTRSWEGKAVEQCIVQHDLQKILLHNNPADHAATQEITLESKGPAGEAAVLARARDIMLPGTELESQHTEPEAQARADTGKSSQPPTSVSPALVRASSSEYCRMLVLTDISELTRMIQVKTDFAANASHELRTPLSAIRAAVETLMQIDLAKDAASAQNFLEVIDRHSNRLESMVADLLDLSRIESTPSQFQPASINLRDMCSELRMRYAERLESKKLAWSIDQPSNATTIEANPHLLRMILDNLVDNAIKFTEDGGHIRIRCEKTDAAVSIVVADDGCGIPEEDQPRVFERFYQVQRARSGSARGTGLGLSIVRHAIAAMHGTVVLRSKPEQGTTITITIPQLP